MDMIKMLDDVNGVSFPQPEIGLIPRWRKLKCAANISEAWFWESNVK